ncbi:MAG TPA: hypothetical protein VGR57_08615 [Ktedonobacterales bacterium]|nr:hypothetical protein [Ktedonobacterales bacterium]
MLMLGDIHSPTANLTTWWRDGDRSDWMETRSVRLMLLGIGVLLFAMVSGSMLGYFLNIFYYLRMDRVLVGLLYSILPLMGLALLLVGFFWKPRTS